MAMAEVASEKLRRYREDHKIEPIEALHGIFGVIYACRHDRIRIHKITGGWRHDSAEIARLTRGEL
jgi:hypothetical protein